MHRSSFLHAVYGEGKLTLIQPEQRSKSQQLVHGAPHAPTASRHFRITRAAERACLGEGRLSQLASA